VDLTKARERHLEARRLLADGIDPGAERKTASRTSEEVAWREARDIMGAQDLIQRRKRLI
jgi:hypothetical protein